MSSSLEPNSSKSASSNEDVKVSASMARYLEAVEPGSCLAQTMRISQVSDIPGADRIQAYTVGGWKCVAAKNAFKKGELVVYIRIGAVLDPSLPQWAFLEGNPLKTKKIRSVISQGLIGSLNWIPSHDLPEVFKLIETEGKLVYRDSDSAYCFLPENLDLTKILHVRKYVESEESNLYGAQSSSHKQTTSPTIVQRPSFIPKTDVERVQNITQQQWQDLKGMTAYNTRKEDGTSATYWFKPSGTLASLASPDPSHVSENNSPHASILGGTGELGAPEFGICSRNCSVTANAKGQEHYGMMNQKFNIEQKLRALNRPLAIQGEIVGPKINGNRMQLTDYDFRVFGMWDIEKQCYLDPKEVWELAGKMKLNTVPLISTVVIGDKESSSDFWLQQAESQKYVQNVQAEGVVFMIHDQFRHLRFKAISNNYLLKHNL